MSYYNSLSDLLIDQFVIPLLLDHIIYNVVKILIYYSGLSYYKSVL
jgi:hypothetical protein